MAKDPKYTYHKRIHSLFGVILPPKKKKIYNGFLTLRFLLTGTLPSKKNQWIAANNFKQLAASADKTKSVTEVLAYISENLKAYIRPNNNYIAFEKRTILLLVDQAAYYQKKFARFGLSYPIDTATSSIYFYWSDNKGRDSTNKAETIHDLLVDSGILSNDSWQKLTPIQLDGEDYNGEILENIICIDICVKYPETLQERLEMFENDGKEGLKAAAPRVKEIKRKKRSKYGIENPDLIIMGWYGYEYNPEDDGEIAIDLTPDPAEWNFEERESLRKLGYDIPILTNYYNNIYHPPENEKT